MTRRPLLACVLLGIFALGLASSAEQDPSSRVTASATGDTSRDISDAFGTDINAAEASDTDINISAGAGADNRDGTAGRDPNVEAALGNAGILDVPGLTPETDGRPRRDGRPPQQSKQRGRHAPTGHSRSGTAGHPNGGQDADAQRSATDRSDLAKGPATGATTVRETGGPTGSASANRTHPPASQRSAGYLGQSAEIPTGVQRTLDGPQVALTFDDGPDAATPRILDLLRQYSVKATFCVIGINVQAHPELVRRMVAEGHTLCNHTWRHDLHLGSRSPDEIRADLQRTTDEIHRAAPDAPVAYFRHPGGNFTAASGAVASSLGMVSLGWSIDPRDWDLQRSGPGQALTDRVVGVVQGQCRPGSVVLSHDGGNDRSSTVAAYEALLPWLKARYDLVPLPV